MSTIFNLESKVVSAIRSFSQPKALNPWEEKSKKEDSNSEKIHITAERKDNPVV